MTLYQEIKAAGIPFSNHESDLYFKRTPESMAILINKYPLEYRNSSTFQNNIDGKLWVDVPFAFAPWWEARQSKSA